MKAHPLLSIIIITKNEEKYIGKLLDSIKQQNFPSPFELIVADNSEDSTAAIAKRYGAKIVEGRSPCAARNSGARNATSHLLLFLDADVILQPNFLRLAYSEFVRRRLDIATVYFTPLSNNPIDVAMHEIGNLYQLLAKRLRPLVPGACFIITAKKFSELGGFDESVPWFDDYAFSTKLTKAVKFDILPLKIVISVRRQKRVGRLKYALTILWLAAHLIFKKPYRGHYFS